MSTAEAELQIKHPVWEELRGAFECRVLLCEEEDGFSAHVINLPGIVSQGETEAEAISNIKEAYQGAIELYRESGEGIPLSPIDRTGLPEKWKEQWVVVNV